MSKVFSKIPILQIPAENIEIGDKNSVLFGKIIIRIQFLPPKALPSSRTGSVPEKAEHLIGKIVKQIPVCVINQKKGDSISQYVD